MFNFSPHILLQIVLRTIIVYLVVLVGIRLTGKRQVGQLTPFDLAFLLLLSNAVQNAMTGPDTSVTGGIAAAATLFAVTALIAGVLVRNRKLQHVIEGTPTVLISKGKIIEENLKKEGLTTDMLNTALREHGVVSASDVELAVLEIDGSISVIRLEDFREEARTRIRHGVRFLRSKH